MVAIALAADAPFFDEWSRLYRTARRSLPRAAEFADALGLDLAALRAIVVVGSKGKATAATYAAAALAAEGFRVGLISSPPIVTNRERIRLGGLAIDPASYDELSTLVAGARSRLALPSERDGYLSPSGLYMLAGLHWLQRQSCDVYVVEAGMGGRSDEVSLLSPEVVAVTPIFAEHVGVLGNTIAEIAEEKLGVVTASTRAVVSSPQSPEVRSVFDARRIEARFVSGETMHETNAAVGVAAAESVERRPLRPPNSREHDGGLRARRSTFFVHLPGRLTTHVDADGRRWLCDAAVNAEGVANAVQHAREVERVLVSLPDNKDVQRTAEWLDAHVGRERWRPVVPPHAQHLSYSPDGWGRNVLPWEEARAWANDARSIVSAGSWSFMSAVLHALGVDNERAFSVR